MTISVTQAEKAHEAFNSVIPVYQELKAAGGGLSPFNTSFEAEARNLAKATISDLIADVEIAARSLAGQEQDMFAIFYKLGAVIPGAEEQNPNSFEFKLQKLGPEEQQYLSNRNASLIEKLGHALIERGIYPLEGYGN